MSQQLFFSPAHRKALDKKKLRKGNSSHLSIPARAEATKTAAGAREGMDTQVLHLHTQIWSSISGG